MKNRTTVSRRDFIGGAAGFAATGLMAGCTGLRAGTKAPAIAGDMAWGLLLQLGGNMWGGGGMVDWSKAPRSREEERRMHPDHKLNQYGTWPSVNRNYLRVDEDVWRRETDLMRTEGLNLVVIDIGEGLAFPSHPELAVNGSWSPDKMRAELRRLRAMGLEPVPKLNFSSCHDAWLKEYRCMPTTRKYYEVVADVIRDTCEVFDTPRYFHIGYDEEMWTAQKTRKLVIIRQGDLWWHDFLYTVSEVEKNGSRALCWSDAYWTGRDEFKKRMPKSVLQSNWYYRSDFSEKKMVWNPTFEKEGGWGESVHGAITFLELEKAGYDQLPCPGNFWGEPAAEAVVKFCKEHVDPSRLKGFLMSTWAGTTHEEEKKITDGIREFGAVKRAHYPKGSDMRKSVRNALAARGLLVGAVLVAGVSFGRGEPWLPKPPVPPPAETLTNEARYLEWKWRTDVTDPATGLRNDAAVARMAAMSAELKDREPWCVAKAKMFAALCDEIAIGVSPLDWFPAAAAWKRLQKPMIREICRRDDEIERKFYPDVQEQIDAGNASGKWAMWKDFDHSAPEWEKILRLGFPGMKRRLREHWQDTPYYRACDLTVDAEIRFVKRLAAYAKASPDASSPRMRKQIAALEQLSVGAPRTAYEVMEFIFVYWFLSEQLDAIQCRSISIIDRTLWPYYRADLAAGRTTEAEFREQFRHFLWQWGSFDNYWGQPVTMGGTKPDGTTEYNPLSTIILEVMDECALPTPKFHLKVGKSTPRTILRKALDMLRRHRSISLIGEEPVIAIFESQGIPHEEAVGFYTTGCYEVCMPNGANDTGSGHLNILYPIERMMADAAAEKFRPADFETFLSAYLTNAVAGAEEMMAMALVFEQHLDDVNPANVCSLAMENSVKTGRDGFANGSERGKGTGVSLSGFGTAVDALAAVQEFVYEKKELTLAEFGRILAADWKGYEELRLRVCRSKRKWGNNDPKANAIAVRIAKAFSAAVNEKPNARGGVFHLSSHNARQFVWLGEKTGATPDGRRKGDETSKNLSPTPGADTEGATALVASLGVLDSKDFPGDFPLDVMLLPGTVAGEKGLDAMEALVRRYFANGGFVVQFNVVDPAELRDAQAHPEKYENLQVRVCGWNVRWNDLTRAEQDAYILRAETIQR